MAWGTGAGTVVHQEVHKNDAGLIFAPPMRCSKGSDFRAIACKSFYRQEGQNDTDEVYTCGIIQYNHIQTATVIGTEIC